MKDLMVDMNAALLSFQSAVDNSEIAIQQADLDKDLAVHMDIAGGKPRFTYAYFAGNHVTAFASITQCDLLDGKPCFQIGYAVRESHRGKGLAKKVASAAIAELTSGLRRNGPGEFVVEAAVDIDNSASLAVAKAVICEHGKDAIDDNSGGQIRLFHKTIE